MKLNKFTISFSTIKPFLLMALFVLCILNAGIVRSDENRNYAEKIATTQYCSDLNRVEKFLMDSPDIIATMEGHTDICRQHRRVNIIINYPNS